MADTRALGAGMHRWLLDSGAQVRTSGPSYGGVYAGYDTRARRWNYIYPEITGYAVSIFTMLHRETGDGRYRTAAVDAADFLLRIQGSRGTAAGGAFPAAASASDASVTPEYYSFDTAMCIQGLVSLHELTAVDAYLDAARRAGDWMLGMQREDGSFDSRLDARTGSRANPGPYFHQDAGCLHGKHAVGLLQLARATGDARYESSARRVCDWVIGLQDVDGAFWVNRTRSHVYTHAHCYATEGLLAAYDWLGVAAYGTAVERACAWLRSVTTRHGILGTHKTSPELERVESQTTRVASRLIRRVWPRREIATDATIQAARIFRFRAARGDDPMGDATATRLMEAVLPRVAYRGEDPAARGGIHARLDLSLGVARRAPLIATWPVQFGAHACIQTIDRNSAGHVVF
jgi:hypothetical protein